MTLISDCSRVAIIAMMMAASAASAETVEAPKTDAANASTGGLEEIIVTAQKKSENLQSVPISVTAVTGAAVGDMHAATIQALQGTVPNVQINNFSNTPNTAAITIRGIGVIEPDPYAGNTVSIVVDGVPQFFSMGALVDLYDVNRIEVLRGPQGTLFGANTTGGVINIVNEAPGSEFGGKAEVTLGNYKRIDGSATINLPIVKDVLAARFSAAHQGHDGWVTNIVDGSDMGKRDVTIFRGALKYTPSADFDATLVGEFDKARNGAPVVVAGNVPGDMEYIPAGTSFPNTTATMYQSPCMPAGQPCHAPGKYLSGNDSVPDISDMDTYRAVLTMNYRNTAVGDLTSITGYKHFDLFEYTDQDGTPAFLADTRRRTKGWQFSQELRNSFDLGDAINLTLGGFYLKTHYDHQGDTRVPFFAPGLLTRNGQNQDNWSGSLFGQAYIDLTDRLRAQAGIRYTHERTSMLAGTVTSINLSGATNFDGTDNVELLSASPPRKAETWNNIGWKLGLDYQVTDGAMVYVSWARGFKSGGFTGRLGADIDLGPYDPEKVDTYETGIKADLLDRRLRINLSGFYTNYRDMQIATIYFTTDAGGNYVQGNSIVNAGKSSIKGFELEATALPVDGLTLNGSLAYLDAKYKRFDYFDTGAGAFRNLRGYALQNAPKWSATAGAKYEFALGGGKTSARVLYSYVSSKYLTAINDTPRSLVQPTHLIDANLDWAPEDARWSIGVWGRNLLDNHYIASVYDAPGTLGLVNYAPPRQYGATVKVNW